MAAAKPSVHSAASGAQSSRTGSGARAPAPSADSEDTAQQGLAHNVRGLLSNLVNAARTRGELLQVELEEEKLRVTGIAVFAVAGAFFIALSVVVLTFFLILLFWDGNRVLATGLIGAGYLLIGIVLVLLARSRAAIKSKLFSASLAELKKDSAALNK